MKALLMIAFMAIGLIAGTQYKMPAFEVKESPLYCQKEEVVVVYKVGEIVSGDYVISNCSKNKETIEKRVNALKKTNQEEIKKFKKREPVALPLIIILSIAILFYVYKLAHTKEEAISLKEFFAFAGIVVINAILVAQQFQSANSAAAHLGIILVMILLTMPGGIIFLIGLLAVITLFWMVNVGVSAILPTLGIFIFLYVLKEYLLEQKR